MRLLMEAVMLIGVLVVIFLLFKMGGKKVTEKTRKSDGQEEKKLKN
jgi:hypothetical protein